MKSIFIPTFCYSCTLRISLHGNICYSQCSRSLKCQLQEKLDAQNVSIMNSMNYGIIEISLLVLDIKDQKSFSNERVSRSLEP